MWGGEEREEERGMNRWLRGMIDQIDLIDFVWREIFTTVGIEIRSSSWRKENKALGSCYHTQHVLAGVMMKTGYL